MKPVINHLMPAIAVWFLWYSDISIGDEIQEESEGLQGDYCLTESFQPHCMKNEIILMKSATYGRMRIGRCITAEEIDKLRSHYLGCSENLLPFFDRKCSGKTDCEISHNDISLENNNPCPPGLNIYLEVSYDCISIVDERRSCVVDATANPIHIISSTSCGSKSQPWIVEAPVGQKLSIGLFDLAASDRPTNGTQNNGRQSCLNRGLIVDKAGKRNVSICAGGTQREKKLYSSTGNLLHIFLTHLDQRENKEHERQFILKLQAVGCSNIIPPVDGYAKRNGDAIMIGCYASRKTWHLNCEDGKWVGVIGNCSQGVHAMEEVAESEPITTKLINNEQVLVFVAIGGFTFAICLAIVCLGVVCMRRFRVKSKMKRDYKTLIPNCNFSSAANQSTDNRVRSVAQEFTGNNVNGLVPQELPTYSVFVGDGEFNDVSNNISAENNQR